VARPGTRLGNPAIANGQNNTIVPAALAREAQQPHAPALVARKDQAGLTRTARRPLGSLTGVGQRAQKATEEPWSPRRILPQVPTRRRQLEEGEEVARRLLRHGAKKRLYRSHYRAAAIGTQAPSPSRAKGCASAITDIIAPQAGLPVHPALTETVDNNPGGPGRFDSALTPSFLPRGPINQPLWLVETTVHVGREAFGFYLPITKLLHSANPPSGDT